MGLIRLGGHFPNWVGNSVFSKLNFHIFGVPHIDLRQTVWSFHVCHAILGFALGSISKCHYFLCIIVGVLAPNVGCHNVVEPYTSMSNNSLVLIGGMKHVIILILLSCNHSNLTQSLTTLAHKTPHIFFIIVTTVSL
jgi:hypothetical protein